MKAIEVEKEAYFVTPPTQILETQKYLTQIKAIIKDISKLVGKIDPLKSTSYTEAVYIPFHNFYYFLGLPIKLSERLYQILKNNKSDVLLSAKSFAKGLKLFIFGSFIEKMRFVFDIYDSDGLEFISKDNVLSLITMIPLEENLTLLNDSAVEFDHYAKLKTVIEKTFESKLKLSFEDFKEVQESCLDLFLIPYFHLMKVFSSESLEKLHAKYKNLCNEVKSNIKKSKLPLDSCMTKKVDEFLLMNKAVSAQNEAISKLLAALNEDNLKGSFYIFNEEFRNIEKNISTNSNNFRKMFNADCFSDDLQMQFDVDNSQLRQIGGQMFNDIEVPNISQIKILDHSIIESDGSNSSDDNNSLLSLDINYTHLGRETSDTYIEDKEKKEKIEGDLQLITDKEVKDIFFRISNHKMYLYNTICKYQLENFIYFDMLNLESCYLKQIVLHSSEEKHSFKLHLKDKQVYSFESHNKGLIEDLFEYIRKLETYSFYNERISVEKCIGEFSYSKTYSGFCAKNNKKVCVREISKDLLGNEEQRRKVQTELDIHRYLSHPNILSLLDFYENESHYYIVTENKEFPTLEDVLKQGIKCSSEIIREIFKQLALVLYFLHSNGIILGGINTNNVLVKIEFDSAEKTLVVLKDISFSKFVLRRENLLVESYTDDENYNNEGVASRFPYGITGESMKIDIWFLGQIIYSLCNGCKPNEKLSSTNQDFSNLSSYLTSAIKSCLQADPFQRISSRNLLLHQFFTEI